MGIIPTPLLATETLSQTTRLCTRRQTRHKMTRNNCLLITCYLPQYLAKYDEVCLALNTLTTTYPNYNHFIILGGDFQGDGTSPSDRSCNLRTLPFILFEGLQLPTSTPTHHQSQTTCIDHFLIYDSHHIILQSKDTHTTLHANLDNNGVKATIHIPLLHPPPHSTTNLTCEPDQPQSIRFQFPFPRPILAQWSEEMREETE
jgi:hypothetical protein